MTYKNILYNSTYSWNPGDEFILMGVQNILKPFFPNQIPLIYNRNPDIRQSYIPKELKTMKYPLQLSKKLEEKLNILNIGFFDNSVKFDTDLSFVDLAVFAGTPENFSPRCTNLYEHIIKNKIPTLMLGIGDKMDGEPMPFMKEVIEKSNLITVRSKTILNYPWTKIRQTYYLPCPALLSVPFGEEKIISKVKNIGLCMGVSLKNTVVHTEINQETFDYISDIYPKLIKKYQDKYNFSIICHYIDELPIAHQLFDKYNIPILYSFRSTEYIEIYKKFDLVISSRVHGCGISSSLNIPNICVAHDIRSDTCEGFLSEFINCNMSFSKVEKIFNNLIQNIKQKNKALKEHKLSTFKSYQELIKSNLNLDKVEYNTNHYYPYPECPRKLSSISQIEKFSFPRNFYLFKKTRSHTGRIRIYIMGIKVFSFNRQNKHKK